jgi:hypothetical protein
MDSDGRQKSMIHCNVARYICARAIEKVKTIRAIRTLRKLLTGTIGTMRKEQ